MIDGRKMISALSGAGFGLITGVPCSFLTPLMNGAISHPDMDYLGATSEGEAVAIASGAWLGGTPAVAMMQNSGLGNAVNPITSLSHTLDVPCLLIVTHRGAPGLSDEPQHTQMGEITHSLLTLMGVPALPFPQDDAEIEGFAQAAMAQMQRTRRPVVTVMPKGAVAKLALDQDAVHPAPRAAVEGAFMAEPPPRRSEVLDALRRGLSPQTGLVATTGYCARELYALGDAARNLYVVGSMGGASAIGLGASIASNQPIAVLDGDGAMLMKLGNLATIATRRPAQFTHVVLDNAMHESTGRQQTVSPAIDFAEIAAAAGYRAVYRADTLDGLSHVLKGIDSAPSPRFLHMRVRPSDWLDLPRPSISPPEVASRFRSFLQGQA